MSAKAKSSIWYHFEQVQNEQGKASGGKCKYCHKFYAISAGSTGNLRRHLKNKHPTVPLDREDSVAPREVAVDSQGDVSPRPSSSSTPQRLLTQFMPKRVTSVGSKALDNQLLKMICKELQPFSIVEDPEFRHFVNLLNPSYTLPSRKTLTNSLLPALYQDVLKRVNEQVKEAESIGLTCDGWTNTKNESFYALTAHFFKSNTELSSVLLECSEFPERHTAENIAAWIDAVLIRFSIKNIIDVIVTDNAANIKLAAKILKIPHISCFAHTLNLVVQSAISKSLKPLVESSKAVVQHFKKSSHALQKLHEMQQKLQVPMLKLKQDVPTRWNSTFDMLDRLYKNKAPVISTLAILDSNLQIKAEQWEEMAHAVKVLEPFNEVTVEVSSEKHVTLSKLPVLSRLLQRSVKICKSDSLPNSVNHLCDLLTEGLEKRFSSLESNQLVAEATLLDPRFKRQGFSDEEYFTAACETVISKISAIPGQAPTDVDDGPVKETVNARSVWQDFDESVKKQRKLDPTQQFGRELEKFLSEPHLERTGDPAKWWEERKLIFPNLYNRAIKRLNVPATSVPCERIFSQAGQICTEKRSQMTTSNVEKVMFISQNL